MRNVALTSKFALQRAKREPATHIIDFIDVRVLTGRRGKCNGGETRSRQRLPEQRSARLTSALIGSQKPRSLLLAAGWAAFFHRLSSTCPLVPARSQLFHPLPPAQLAFRQLRQTSSDSTHSAYVRWSCSHQLQQASCNLASYSCYLILKNVKFGYRQQCFGAGWGMFSPLPTSFPFHVSRPDSGPFLGPFLWALPS